MLTLCDDLGKTYFSTSFALKFDVMRNQTIATNTGGKYATCYTNQHVLRLSSIDFFKYMYMCVCV